MSTDDLKHAQRERLIFLDKQFVWNGMAKRKNLIDQFGISTPQAALDFKEYLSRQPKTSLTYDASLKGYFPNSDFTPLFPLLSLEPAQTLIAARLGLDNSVLPSLKREADPATLARLSRAMSRGEALTVKYISMSSGDRALQRIAPTRFASDGERIHMRAFSFKHNEFRDYLPARIDSIDETHSGRLSSPLTRDVDWHSTAFIWLKAKSGLTPVQKAMVAREYEFEDGLLCVAVRKALEFYVDRRWGLNLDSTRLERLKTEYFDVDIEDYVRT